jgi:hypothetical protein
MNKLLIGDQVADQLASPLVELLPGIPRRCNRDWARGRATSITAGSLGARLAPRSVRRGPIGAASRHQRPQLARRTEPDSRAA